MQITNLNPDSDIGASAWLVDYDGYRLLLDSGVHPEREGREGLPLFDKAGPEPIDAIALSHCHHDHVGSLPVAIRHFPSAQVFMTDQSYFLVERILHNSVNVMMRQRTELGIRDYPLYSHEELDEQASVFQAVGYRKPIDWVSFPRGQRKSSPKLEFFDAGHTLGSAGIRVTGGKQTLFYSGDACFHDQTLLKAARFDDIQADVMILETTRGGRAVPPGFSREAEMESLATAMEETLDGKGSVLIPAFALGRTQEMLAALSMWMKAGRFKRRPIYIGGLGRVFTEIYDLQAHRTHRSHPRLRLTEAVDLKVVSPQELSRVGLKDGKIFLMTAGMMTENTGAHDLALRMIGDPRQSIFFVGYSAPESPAGRLRAAADGSTFMFSGAGGELTRKCRVEAFDLTAHANREDLVDFVAQVQPKVVVLGHGDTVARSWFAQTLRQRWPQMQVLEPGPGERVAC